MGTKQTAVEFLIDKIKYNDFVKAFDAAEWLEIRTQAKQMEKEQIIEARDNGIKSAIKGYGISSEQYYNETYGDNN